MHVCPTLIKFSCSTSLPLPLHTLPSRQMTSGPTTKGRWTGMRNFFTHPVMPPTPQSTTTAALTSFTILKPTDIHYHSKVWDHPDNFMFSMRTHTFIHQMSCKMNIKYSQDIDDVRNNYFYLKYKFCPFRSKNSQFADLWHSSCQFVKVI